MPVSALAAWRGPWGGVLLYDSCVWRAARFVFFAYPPEGCKRLPVGMSVGGPHPHTHHVSGKTGLDRVPQLPVRYR